VLALALARELSGETQLDRARENVCAGASAQGAASEAALYVEVTEARFNGVRRCC